MHLDSAAASSRALNLVAVSPVSSPDGQRIFFIGRLDSGELVRYDPKSAHWLSYLPVCVARTSSGADERGAILHRGGSVRV